MQIQSDTQCTDRQINRTEQKSQEQHHTAVRLHLIPVVEHPVGSPQHRTQCRQQETFGRHGHFPLESGTDRNQCHSSQRHKHPDVLLLRNGLSGKQSQQNQQHNRPRIVDGLCHLCRQQFIRLEQHQIVGHRIQQAQCGIISPLLPGQASQQPPFPLYGEQHRKYHQRGQAGHPQHLKMRQITQRHLERRGYRRPAQHRHTGTRNRFVIVRHLIASTSSVVNGILCPSRRAPVAVIK